MPELCVVNAVIGSEIKLVVEGRQVSGISIAAAGLNIGDQIRRDSYFILPELCAIAAIISVEIELTVKASEDKRIGKDAAGIDIGDQLR